MSSLQKILVAYCQAEGIGCLGTKYLSWTDKFTVLQFISIVSYQFKLLYLKSHFHLFSCGNFSLCQWCKY